LAEVHAWREAVQAGCPLVSHPSTAWPAHVVTALVAGGVTEVVIAPGSRNAPLSFAVYDAAEAGLLRLHTRIDERSPASSPWASPAAGARGRRDEHVGHGVANLHPGRPRGGPRRPAARGRSPPTAGPAAGTNANQTTDQVGSSGRLVETLDLAAPADRSCPVPGSPSPSPRSTGRCTSTSPSTSRSFRRSLGASGSGGGRHRRAPPVRRKGTGDSTPARSPHGRRRR
jgi:hypothetical protein